MTATQLLRKMNILTPYKKEDVVCGIAHISELFGLGWCAYELDCTQWTRECYELLVLGTRGDIKNLAILARNSPTDLVEEALEQLLKIRLKGYIMNLQYLNPTEPELIENLFGEYEFDSPKWNAVVWNRDVGFVKGAPDYYNTWDEILDMYKDGTMTEFGEEAIKKSFEGYRQEDILAGLALICEELFRPEDVQEPDCIPWTQESPDTEDDNFDLRCDFILYGSSGNVTKLLATAHKAPQYLIEEAIEQLLKIRLFNWGLYLYENEDGDDPCDQDFDSPEWNAEMFNIFMGFEKGDREYFYTWRVVLDIYKNGTLTELGQKAVVRFLASPPQVYSYDKNLRFLEKTVY